MNLKSIDISTFSINSDLKVGSISLSKEGSLFPIAPLITVVGTKDGSDNLSYFFRIVVFIDSDNTKPPVFSVDETNTSQFYVSFNLPEKEPTKFSAWYIEAYYPTNRVGDLTVYLQNEDPKTSRGTVTTVIVVVPEKDISENY